MGLDQTAYFQVIDQDTGVSKSVPFFGWRKEYKLHQFLLDFSSVDPNNLDGFFSCALHLPLLERIETSVEDMGRGWSINGKRIKSASLDEFLRRAKEHHSLGRGVKYVSDW